jgi:AcrR family transcriptional regulator
MTEEKQDRRSRRTRQVLIQALLDLLGSRHYDAITVQDIVDRANVGRSTFYAHFQDKDDLLRSGFGHVLDMLVEHIALGEDGQVVFDTSMLFQHAAGHYEIYRTLIWGSGLDVLTGDGHAMLSRKIEERFALLQSAVQPPSIPLSITAYSVAGAVLLLLKWWLDHKMPHSPERMDAIFQQLVMPGVRHALTSAEDEGQSDSPMTK